MTSARFNDDEGTLGVHGRCCSLSRLIRLLAAHTCISDGVVVKFRMSKEPSVNAHVGDMESTRAGQPNAVEGSVVVTEDSYADPVELALGRRVSFRKRTLKAERELERAFFSAVYAMEAQNFTYRKKSLAFVGLVVDFLQILTFTFSEQFGWPTEVDKIASYLTADTHAGGSWGFQVTQVLFYIAVSLIFGSFLLLPVVVWMFQKNDIKLWALRILRTVTAFLITIGYIPVTKVLLSIYRCGDGAARCSEMYSLQILAVVVLAVFVPFCLIVALLYFDPNPKSELPFARRTARVDFIYIVFKTVLVFLNRSGDIHPISVLISMDLAFASMLFVVVLEVPHFRPWSNRIRAACFSAVLSASVSTTVLYLTDTLATANEPGAWVALPLGVMTVGAVIGAGIMQLRMRPFLSIPLPDLEMEQAMMHKGRSSSVHTTATTAHLKRSHTAKVDAETQIRHVDDSSRSHQHCLDYLTQCYHNIEFSARLVILHTLKRAHSVNHMAEKLRAKARESRYKSAFVLACYGNFVLAYFPERWAEVAVVLQEARHLHPSFDVRWLLHHLEKDLEQTQPRHTLGDGEVGKANLMTYVEVQRNVKVAKKFHKSVLQAMLHFWELHLAEDPDLRKVIQLVKQIDTMEKGADHAYISAIRASPKQPSLWRSYAVFVEEVLGDNNRSQMILQFADELEQYNSQQLVANQDTGRARRSSSILAWRVGPGTHRRRPGKPDGTPPQSPGPAHLDTPAASPARRHLRQSSSELGHFWDSFDRESGCETPRSMLLGHLQRNSTYVLDEKAPSLQMSPTMVSSHRQSKKSSSSSMEERKLRSRAELLQSERKTKYSDRIERLGGRGAVQHMVSVTTKALASLAAVMWVAYFAALICLAVSDGNMLLLTKTVDLRQNVSLAPGQARQVIEDCMSGSPVCLRSQSMVEASSDAMVATRTELYGNASSAAKEVWSNHSLVLMFPRDGLSSIPPTDRSESQKSSLFFGLDHYATAFGRTAVLPVSLWDHNFGFVALNAHPIHDFLSRLAREAVTRVNFFVDLIIILFITLLGISVIVSAIITTATFRPAFSRVLHNRVDVLGLFRHIPRKDVAAVVHRLRSVLHSAGVDEHHAFGESTLPLETQNGPQAVGGMAEQTRLAMAREDRKYLLQFVSSLALVIGVFLIVTLVSVHRVSELKSFPQEVDCAMKCADEVVWIRHMSQELAIRDGAVGDVASLRAHLSSHIERLGLVYGALTLGNPLLDLPGSYRRDSVLQALDETDVRPRLVSLVRYATMILGQNVTQLNQTRKEYEAITDVEPSLRTAIIRSSALYASQLSSAQYIQKGELAGLAVLCTVVVLTSVFIMSRSIGHRLLADASRTARMLLMIPEQTIESVEAIRNLLGVLGASETPRSRQARFYRNQVNIAHSVANNAAEAHDLNNLCKILLLQEHYEEAVSVAEQSLTCQNRAGNTLSEEQRFALHTFSFAMLLQGTVGMREYPAALEVACRFWTTQRPHVFDKGVHKAPKIDAKDLQAVAAERGCNIVVYCHWTERKWDNEKNAEYSVEVIYVWVFQGHLVGNRIMAPDDVKISFSRREVPCNTTLAELVRSCRGDSGLALESRRNLDEVGVGEDADADDDDRDDDDQDTDSHADSVVVVSHRSSHRSKGEMGKQLHEHLRTLYALLIEPSEKGFFSGGGGGIDSFPNVVVVPEGVLHLVPFAELSNGSSKAVGARCCLSHIPSVRSVLTLAARQPPPSETRGEIIGNPMPCSTPYYEGVSESRSIYKAARHAHVLTGVNADQKTVIEKLSTRPRFVHFATHCLLSSAEEDPEEDVGREAYVLLANDAQFSESRVRTMDLAGIQLVVLSAVDHRTWSDSPDHLNGLALAFLDAGVQNVVVSMWLGSSSVVQHFLKSFYRNFCADKHSLSECLRQAVASTEGSVYDLGGFILWGLPGPLTAARRSSSMRRHVSIGPKSFPLPGVVTLPDESAVAPDQ